MNHTIPKKASFRTILADPPWEERGAGKIVRGANRHYDLMTIDQATYYLVSSAWNGLIQLYEYCSLDKAMGKFASEMNDNVWDIVKLWKISPGRFWSEKREVLMQQSHREIYRAEEEAEFIHV